MFGFWDWISRHVPGLKSEDNQFTEQGNGNMHNCNDVCWNHLVVCHRDCLQRAFDMGRHNERDSLQNVLDLEIAKKDEHIQQLGERVKEAAQEADGYKRTLGKMDALKGDDLGVALPSKEQLVELYENLCWDDILEWCEQGGHGHPIGLLHDLITNLYRTAQELRDQKVEQVVDIAHSEGSKKYSQAADLRRYVLKSLQADYGELEKKIATDQNLPFAAQIFRFLGSMAPEGADPGSQEDLRSELNKLPALVWGMALHQGVTMRRIAHDKAFQKHWHPAFIDEADGKRNLLQNQLIRKKLKNYVGSSMTFENPIPVEGCQCSICAPPAASSQPVKETEKEEKEKEKEKEKGGHTQPQKQGSSKRKRINKKQGDKRERGEKKSEEREKDDNERGALGELEKIGNEKTVEKEHETGKKADLERREKDRDDEKYEAEKNEAEISKRTGIDGIKQSSAFSEVSRKEKGIQGRSKADKREKQKKRAADGEISDSDVGPLHDPYAEGFVAMETSDELDPVRDPQHKNLAVPTSSLPSLPSPASSNGEPRPHKRYKSGKLSEGTSASSQTQGKPRPTLRRGGPSHDMSDT